MIPQLSIESNKLPLMFRTMTDASIFNGIYNVKNIYWHIMALDTIYNFQSTCNVVIK